MTFFVFFEIVSFSTSFPPPANMLDTPRRQELLATAVLSSSLVTPEYPKKTSIITPQVVDDVLAASDLAMKRRSFQVAHGALSMVQHGPVSPVETTNAMLAPRPGKYKKFLPSIVVIVAMLVVLSLLRLTFASRCHQYLLPISK